MANGNGNGRLKALENIVFLDNKAELTQGEKRQAFLWTLYDHAGRTLAYKLPYVPGGRLISFFNALSSSWLPMVELTPEEADQFEELAWTSRLYLAALLAMVQSGSINGDPDMLQARIIELIADDYPDLGRTASGIMPWNITWSELLAAQRAAGYGVYGPRPGCKDRQDSNRQQLSIEIYWSSQVATWLEYYGPEIVGEFVPLATLKFTEK